MSLSYPTKLLDQAFANASPSVTNNVPDTIALGSPLASYQYGFQAITMSPVTAGGIPPEGQDFNGIFFDITTHTVWVNAGGQYRFDSTLAMTLGGYPAGMVLQNNAGTASYISAVANNSIDFNSTPSSIGVQWLPYSKGSEFAYGVATTGGTTALTSANISAGVLVVTGVLTSNAVLTVPNGTVGKWVVENKTTGNFSLTLKTVSGSGASVLQTFADAIYSDGTNAAYQSASAITKNAGDNSQAIATTAYVDRAISDIGGYYTDTGIVNASVITTVPPTVAYTNGLVFRFKIKFTNTLINPTLNAGAGAVIILRDDGGVVQPGDLPAGTLVTVTYDSTAARWELGSVVFSQFGTAAKLNASDTFGGSGLSATQCYGGNPNGFVAGNAGVIGTSAPSECWDTVDQISWTCTASGSSSTAVWVTPALAGSSTNATFYVLGFAM